MGRAVGQALFAHPLLARLHAVDFMARSQAWAFDGFLLSLVVAASLTGLALTGGIPLTLSLAVAVLALISVWARARFRRLKA